jgi:hypothetical protein
VRSPNLAFDARLRSATLIPRRKVSSRATSATIRSWSMTKATASRRNSFGYRPHRLAGLGWSSVTTGMDTSYSRHPASGGMVSEAIRSSVR